ncbi:putative hydrolase of the HAD superfamily [Micromonospora rhizosphaerae]|uniref:Putative hydrolase of the HAD superfamily n=1 Tax=Micromonospora rhizosphaerae TaxID=568872 RepID=A0A1C6T558_9ACTN|nr:HAD-IA family hydrolase [Micromonospora rhizosphaerae]SCL36976.1 putative hydrolase of the HAD superfamily [Micromonospora rhizosphaerae]
MPLLLLDLDNTLLDRAGAFRAWGERFLDGIGAPPADIDWLLSIDADGLTDRWDVADAVRDRYQLRIRAIDLVEELHDGVVANTRLDPLVACALRIADDAGWVPVVVSNGVVRQQDAKIRRTGLDRYVADWLISEEAGVSKPNPRIFALAAQRARMPLRGAWVIGDSPEEDIGGAAAIGLPSVWLHRGRRWSDRRFAPTRTADGLIAAVATVLAEQPEPAARAPRGRVGR